MGGVEAAGAPCPQPITTGTSPSCSPSEPCLPESPEALSAVSAR